MNSIIKIYNISFYFFIILICYEVIFSSINGDEFDGINTFFLNTIIYYTFPVVLLAIEKVLPLILKIYNNNRIINNDDHRYRNKNKGSVGKRIL
jgi:hypothetical protein